MTILPALTYQLVILEDVDGAVYKINPFDPNGNLLSEMTIEVFGDFDKSASFILPIISDLENNFNIQIKFIATLNNNAAFSVNAQRGNTIGYQNALDFESTGRNNVFTPISDNVWSVPQTY